MVTKVMTEREAISKFVNDGDVLTLGGFSTNRRAYGLVHEVIRQKKCHLILESGPSGGDSDMLIGSGNVDIFINSYIANAGYTNVSRRFREAVETGKIMFEDYSLDVQTIAYHGAALGLPYVPVKNMLGSDLEKYWGIPENERKKVKKISDKKFIVQENPFKAGDILCLVPTPKIDVALIHAQKASPDGTVKIEGPSFQDIDIAIAAKHTIISCEELVSNEEMHNNPQENSLPGLCVDAVVLMPYGAHPSQCFGYYDYDSKFFWEYDMASRSQKDFDKFMIENILSLTDHKEYADKIGDKQLKKLHVDKQFGYVPDVDRSKNAVLGKK
ncbi:CoA transferase subunit A [Peptococcus simiae]|uniref:CoA transferase subunit A n=1 Tax=Peptococcus simiae TaxID=1643805 RepID=UPI00398026CF